MNIRTANLPPHLRGDAASVYLAKRAKLLGVIRERQEPTRWQILRRHIADALVLIIGVVLAICAAAHIGFGLAGLVIHIATK